MAALPVADAVVGNSNVVSFLRLNFATQEGCRLQSVCNVG